MGLSFLLGTSLLVGGGGYAAYRYDTASADRLLPGVQIAGVDVGEMSRGEAIAALREQASSNLEREIQVEAAGETWEVTAGDLDTQVVVEPVVDRALAANDDYSWPTRVYRRVFDRPVDVTSDLRFRPDPLEIRSFVESVATEIAQEPTNASVEYEDGQVVLREPEVGITVPIKEAQRALRRGLASGAESVSLPTERVQPKVGRDDLGYTIVVDLSDLTLDLYDGLRVQKTYNVAAGSPEFPTPQGEWTIINKRENPTWVNPQPDGWGKSMPRVIGPGPTNPLGTRALDLNSPGIRIHGTSASYSIGSYASHGCVRMHMADVEELFDIVPVGTKVHIVP